GVSVQVPVTTPLVNVPVLVIVPLDLPVRFPLRVKTLPFVEEVTVRSSVPVTFPLASAENEALPVSVCAFEPVAKQEPSLKNPNPLMSNGPLLVTSKATTKFSRLAWPPLGLMSWASQFPLVDVLVVVDGLLFPQPKTANSSASTTRIASLLMNLP